MFISIFRKRLMPYSDADGGAGGGGTNSNPNPDPTPNPNPQPNPDPPGDPSVKTFSQAELDKILQERVAREQRAWQEKLEKDTAEATRLAKLSAEEREKALKEKQEKELADREATIKQKEMKLEAINILEEKKISTKAVDFLVKSTAEETKAAIESFEGILKAAVEEEVTKRIKDNTYKPGSGGGGEGGMYSAEQLKNLSPAEIAKNWDKVEASLKSI